MTQYQIIDDFSKVIGPHNLKFGVNFRRNDITDYSPGFFTTGEVIGEDQGSFFLAPQGSSLRLLTHAQPSRLRCTGWGLYCPGRMGRS